MSERIPVSEYRKLIGIEPTPPAPKRGGLPQALGRLKQGEMNKTEERYAAHLERRKQIGELLWYAFEPITLRLAPKTTLTIDFFAMAADFHLEFHDVKGARAIYAEDAKAKMKIAASIFFMFKFFVCFPRTAKQGGGWDIEVV